MKKFAIFMLLAGLSGSVHSQKFSAELGYGYWSTMETLKPPSEAWGVPGSPNGFNPQSHRTIGAFSADFHYDWPNRVFIGASLAVQYIEYSGTGAATDVKRWSNSFTVHGGYRYLQFKNVGIYSGVGLGVAILQDEVRDISSSGQAKFLDASMSYQLTLVGFRFGDRLYGMLELGHGYQGMARAGIGYRWGDDSCGKTKKSCCSR